MTALIIKNYQTNLSDAMVEKFKLDKKYHVTGRKALEYEQIQTGIQTALKWNTA